MKNKNTFKSKHSHKIYQIKKNFNCNPEMVVYLIEYKVCGNQYNVVPSESFVLELLTLKAHIAIFKKNKTYLTKLATRNAFISVILRATITGFATGRWQ